MAYTVNKTRYLRALSVFVLVGCVVPTSMAARETRIPTAAEMQVLPPYCKNAEIIEKSPRFPPSAARQHWVNIMGESFWHVHHYCFALNLVNRSFKAPSNTERLGLLERAVDEFDYVVTRPAADNPLMPEYFANRGRALWLMKNGPLAEADWVDAIRLKPDYWYPYVLLADYYRDINNIARASEVIEEGIKRVPPADAKPLQRRQAELAVSKAP